MLTESTDKVVNYIQFLAQTNCFAPQDPNTQPGAKSINSVPSVYAS